MTNYRYYKYDSKTWPGHLGEQFADDKARKEKEVLDAQDWQNIKDLQEEAEAKKKASAKPADEEPDFSHVTETRGYWGPKTGGGMGVSEEWIDSYLNESRDDNPDTPFK